MCGHILALTISESSYTAVLDCTTACKHEHGSMLPWVGSSRVQLAEGFVGEDMKTIVSCVLFLQGPPIQQPPVHSDQGSATWKNADVSLTSFNQCVCGLSLCESAAEVEMGACIK
eukprot:5039028-Amphidinium_carterae.1